MKKQKTMTLQELTQAVYASLAIQQQLTQLTRAAVEAQGRFTESMQQVVASLLKLQVPNVETEKELGSNN